MELNLPTALSVAKTPAGEIPLVHPMGDGAVLWLCVSIKYAQNNSQGQELIQLRACYPKLSKEGNLLSVKVEFVWRQVGEHVVPWGTANASYVSHIGGYVDWPAIKEMLSESEQALMTQWSKAGEDAKPLILGAHAVQAKLKWVEGEKSYWTFCSDGFTPIDQNGEIGGLRIGPTYQSYVGTILPSTLKLLEQLNLVAPNAPTPAPAPNGVEKVVGSLLPATDLENI